MNYWDELRKGRPVTDPIRPSFFGLTDRADGSVWYMTHLQAENRWGITDQKVPVPHMQSWIVVFPANEGPYMTTPDGVCLRMLLRNHRLGYEIVEGFRADSAPLRTRILNFPYFLKLHAKRFVAPGDTLSYFVETTL